MDDPGKRQRNCLCRNPENCVGDFIYISVSRKLAVLRWQVIVPYCNVAGQPSVDEQSFYVKGNSTWRQLSSRAVQDSRVLTTLTFCFGGSEMVSSPFPWWLFDIVTHSYVYYVINKFCGFLITEPPWWNYPFPQTTNTNSANTNWHPS